MGPKKAQVQSEMTRNRGLARKVRCSLYGPPAATFPRPQGTPFSAVGQLQMHLQRQRQAKALEFQRM